MIVVNYECRYNLHDVTREEEKASYFGIREATNIRRMITGIIGGYALTALYCMAIKYTHARLFYSGESSC